MASRRGRLYTLGEIDYEYAWRLQARLMEKRQAGRIPDVILLLQHPHTYTIGKRGGEDHLLTPEGELLRRGIRVFRIDRGGDITYHGPGQIVGYPILDLHDYYLDVHRYLRDLEEVIIRVLARYGISGTREQKLTGVWVDSGRSEKAKIAAIGVKTSRWVTMHGFALNVNTDLEYFGQIVPCGITNRPVTSMQRRLGVRLPLSEVSAVVAEEFEAVFGIRLETRPAEEIGEELQVHLN
jgi:lipoyl(octanoyl) transferase